MIVLHALFFVNVTLYKIDTLIFNNIYARNIN